MRIRFWKKAKPKVVSLRKEDLRINVHRGGIPSRVYVRIIHLPTGISTSAIDESEILAKCYAIQKLEELLFNE